MKKPGSILIRIHETGICEVLIKAEDVVVMVELPQEKQEPWQYRQHGVGGQESGIEC